MGRDIFATSRPKCDILAGLTAVGYLVDHLDLEVTGHVTVDGVANVTPFENGRPRRHTRLFSRPDLDVTVLVAELLVPPNASPTLVDALVEWAHSGSTSEAVVLSGVPIAHGPDEHRTYYVATDGYRERRLAAEVEQYYAGIAERLEERAVSPDDRMYM